AKPGVYTGMALALEVAIVVAAAAADNSEKNRISPPAQEQPRAEKAAREAREQKRAEKAALEAALAAEHAETAEAPTPSPVQQP
ncbi:MAG: hypothetical protein ACTSYK_00855, partial [Alphaproteobacteria bacterium]